MEKMIADINQKVLNAFLITLNNYLTDIDEGSALLPDDIYDKFKNMSRTLQRILSRREKEQRLSIPKKKDESDTTTIHPSSSLNGASILGEEFLFANRIHSDIPVVPKSSENTRMIKPTADGLSLVTGTSIKNPRIKNIPEKVRKYIERTEGNSSPDESDIEDCKLFSSDSSISNDIKNFHESEDEGIVLIAKNIYSCKLCSIDTLPLSNLESHKKGRQHKNNVEKYIETDGSGNSVDVYSVLSDYRKELREDNTGKSYIIFGNNYRCNLCNIEISSVENIRQHVVGSKHKKMCESNR